LSIDAEERFVGDLERPTNSRDTGDNEDEEDETPDCLGDCAEMATPLPLDGKEGVLGAFAAPSDFFGDPEDDMFAEISLWTTLSRL
jgi:hypothetical protein